MKNSTAQSNCSPEENENVAQNSSISKPSVFWFPVYEGVFEHAAIIRDAVWFFMWLIARTTREEDGRGAVLGGNPIPDERPARDLSVQVKTIRRWRRMLLEGDYVEVERASHGYSYTVLKSKKWRSHSKSDRPKVPITPQVIARSGQSECPKREVRVPETGDHRDSILNDNTADNTAEEAAEKKTTAAPPAREKLKTKRYPEAWEAIDMKPRGSWKFVLAWEKFYRDRPECELLSDTMERCVQHCNENGIKPSPPFFEAKRCVERHESQQSFPKAEVHPL